MVIVYCHLRLLPKKKKLKAKLFWNENKCESRGHDKTADSNKDAANVVHKSPLFVIVELEIEEALTKGKVLRKTKRFFFLILLEECSTWSCCRLRQ